MSTAPHASPIRPIAAALCLSALAAASTTHAQPGSFDGSQHLSASLSTPNDTPAPNQPQYLIVTLNHAHDWHTYYPGLNDTGFGTNVTIEPIEGITFADPIFETPERYIAPGNILDHVYHDTAHIYIPFTADPSLAGESHTVTLELDYLICKDLCLPGTTTVSTELAFTDARPQRGTDTATRAVATKLPKPLPPSAISIDKDTVTFELDSATAYTFVPHTDSATFNNLIETGHQNASVMTLTLTDPRGNAPITGRLRVTHADGSTSDYDVACNRTPSVTTSSPLNHTNTKGATP